VKYLREQLRAGSENQHESCRYHPGSFLGPGTYTDTLGAGATLTITDITAVPEPSSRLLLGTGLLGLGLMVKRHIRAVRHH
jgi:PEP-CTERM motif